MATVYLNGTEAHTALILLPRPNRFPKSAVALFWGADVPSASNQPVGHAQEVGLGHWECKLYEAYNQSAIITLIHAVFQRVTYLQYLTVRIRFRGEHREYSRKLIEAQYKALKTERMKFRDILSEWLDQPAE